MLIAILSDIHDNLPNLDKFLSWCQINKVSQIIFCGDMTTIATAAHLSAGFPGEIFMTLGNIEFYSETELEKYKNIRYVGEIGIVELDGVIIGLCHEPGKIDRLLEIAPVDPEFVFYGHTHKPWTEKRGNTTLVNPGNLANEFYQPTFAVLDTVTKKLDLKILADL